MAEKLLELEARLLGELNQDTQDTRVAVGIKVSAAKPEFDFSGWSNEQIAQRCEQMAQKFRRLAGH